MQSLNKFLPKGRVTPFNLARPEGPHWGMGGGRERLKGGRTRPFGKNLFRDTKGQVVIFFVLVIPILLLLLVTTVQFAKIVHEKIRLQGATDQAVYAGASYLTEVLNQTALLNWKVHRLFLDREEDFKRNGSKKTEKEARDQLFKTTQDQNVLMAQMEDLNASAHAKAYQIADHLFQHYFPQQHLKPLARAQTLLKEGPKEHFYFDRIRGVVFDPDGHTHIGRQSFELRMAFVKDPSAVVGFAAEAAIPKYGHSLRAQSAAEPYGGSLWNFALSPNKSDSLLYRTARVPTETFYEDKN